MSSQRRVSAKLHNELQSYSSLLRSLRVQDIMDVTKQIKQKNPFSLTLKDDTRDDELCSADDDEETPFNSPTPPLTPLPSELPQHSEQPIAGPSSFPIQQQKASTKAKGKRRETSRDPAQKKHARDNWTRWPLLVDDVLKPEWSLDDEVGFIVSQLMKTRPPRPDFPVPIAHTDDPHETGDLRAFATRNLEFDPEDPDNPFYVPYITSVVSEYLSWLLALLASHMPARSAGMQNRIEPMGWRAVIDVVVSCGIPEFSNTQIVSNVIERMEAIYGPSILAIEGSKSTRYRAVERMRDKEKRLETFTKTFTEEISKYWRLDPLMNRQVPGPGRRNARVHRIDLHNEREFRPRKKNGAAKATKNAAAAKGAAKAALKKKNVNDKKARKNAKTKGPEDLPESSIPVQKLDTPPQIQSGAASSTQRNTSVRRSGRPRRSTLSYELKSFLPRID